MPVRFAQPGADALRQIIETVEGMILTSETTVENFMLSNDRITTEIRGVCSNFRDVGEPVYMSDGSIELNVEMILGPPVQRCVDWRDGLCRGRCHARTVQRSGTKHGQIHRADC